MKHIILLMFGDTEFYLSDHKKLYVLATGVYGSKRESYKNFNIKYFIYLFLSFWILLNI